MTDNQYGAKQARRQIQQFHAHLNSPNLVPEQCYRMSSSSYTLVNYVNQITGIYLSKNYVILPLFLHRAYTQLMQSEDQRVSTEYRRIVLSYLQHIAQFVHTYHDFSSDESYLHDFIPAALLESPAEPISSLSC